MKYFDENGKEIFLIKYEEGEYSDYKMWVFSSYEEISDLKIRAILDQYKRDQKDYWDYDNKIRPPITERNLEKWLEYGKLINSHSFKSRKSDYLRDRLNLKEISFSNEIFEEHR